MSSDKTVEAAGTRERLLQAGQALVQEHGLQALTVRGVAARAQANIGSFVYHFGSRDAFVEELIERWYSPMLLSLQKRAQNEADSLAALRQAILALTAWVVANRAFLAQVVLAAGAGEAGARRFFKGVDTRHPALLLGLIRRAQEAGRLARDDPRHQLLFLMSSQALPVPIFEWAKRHADFLPPLVGALASFSTDAEACKQRLDWALRGLAAQEA